MADQSFYRVSVVVESISPDEKHEPGAEPFKVIARSEGELFVRQSQALAYLGQIQDAMVVCCDPEAAQ